MDVLSFGNLKQFGDFAFGEKRKRNSNVRETWRWCETGKGGEDTMWEIVVLNRIEVKVS